MRQDYFQERFRPQFHYTSQIGIINDPNGLVWYEGEYHLFHQYNVNNHIHWGHAVSTDLVSWRHLPPALYPDSIGQIWSGSIVVDSDNTSGLQCGDKPALVALFTYNEHVDTEQSQGLAFSRDNGYSWQKYSGNPVLTGCGKRDFRDPKVFWLTVLKCWCMVLACGDYVEFFHSCDLINWHFVGGFGGKEYCRRGVWECPDMFELPLPEGNGHAWVLMVSVNTGAPAGGTGMRYYIGRFDGRSFDDTAFDCNGRWLDYGKDFYAGVTWNNIPDSDGRRLMIAWADNWVYRDLLPTAPFLGQFSCVRELTLKRTSAGLCLSQRPANELAVLRKNVFSGHMLYIKKCQRIISDGSDTLEIMLKCRKCMLDCPIEITLLSGETPAAIITLNPEEGSLSVERKPSRYFDSPEYCQTYRAELDEGYEHSVDILIDRSQLEVFADNGRTVITTLLFSDAHYRVDISAVGMLTCVDELEVFTLRSVWQTEAALFDRLPLDVQSGNWAHTVEGITGHCDTDGVALIKPLLPDTVMEVGIKITDYCKGGRAGLVLDASERLEVLIDADENKLILLRDGRSLAYVDRIINRNRTYWLRTEQNGFSLTVLIDGVPLLDCTIASEATADKGLCVFDTYAFFSLRGIDYRQEGRHNG